MPIDKGKLFLIPSPISENSLHTISAEVVEVIHELDIFIVERIRTARRYISAIHHTKAIDQLTFEEIPEDGVNVEEMDRIMNLFSKGNNIGLMSEAGLPAIADPGNLYVRAAQKRGIKVV